MSERFRTQPITSAERLESDRYRRPSLERSIIVQNYITMERAFIMEIIMEGFYQMAEYADCLL